MRHKLFIAPIVLWLVGAVCFAQQALSCKVPVDAQGNQRANGSQLCVGLAIKGGKLVVDRAQTQFVASDEFLRRLRIAPEAAEKQIYEYLEKIISRSDKPYRYALDQEELKQDREGQLNDELTAKLRISDSAWDKYIITFSEWSEEKETRQPFADVFATDAAFTSGAKLDEPDEIKAGIFAAVFFSSDQTPLIFNEESYDIRRGRFSFSIADPISDWADATQVKFELPDFTGKPAEIPETAAETRRKEARVRQLQQELQPLLGTPYCPQCIVDRLRDFYRRLGFPTQIAGLPESPPYVTPKSARAPVLITVVEAARITRIEIPKETLTDAAQANEIDKVLYNLLDDAAFRFFVANRKTIINGLQANAADAEWVSLGFQEDFKRAGPWLNLNRLQIQQLLMAQLGYVVSYFPVELNTEKFVRVQLKVQKLKETAQVKENTPDAAPPLATDEGLVNAHKQENENKTDFAPTSKKDREVREKKYYLGFGVEYRPGQGVRVFGLGQRSRISTSFAEHSLSAKFGGQQGGGALGSVNYFADYLFFHQLHRRLSFQLNANNDIEPERALNANSQPTTDERRRGASARLEFEPFRDLGGRLLRFHAEGQRTTVALRAQNQTTTTTQNLTTLETGALYLSETSEVEFPRRVRIEPRLKFGLGLAASEPRFTVFSTTGQYHQVLPKQMELDLRGRLESASEKTPLIEQPSFGGEDVVRGFRRDDAIGLRQWCLQNELWLPLPINKQDKNEFKTLLREKVKLAPFFDVGGLYDPSRSVSGIRSGIGLGLRIIYNPIVFRIDYAYGLGVAGTPGSRGKFYFTVSSNLPF